MSNKNLIRNVICGHFKFDNTFTKITIPAWAKEAFTSCNHTNLAQTPSCVSVYVAFLQPSGVCLHLLSTDQLGHGFQRCLKKNNPKNAGGPSDATAPFFPPWTLGPGAAFVSQGEKRLGANRRKQHMESIGAAGRRRRRMIRLDALHLSLWIQALSQFYSQRETFYSPSFE